MARLFYRLEPESDAWTSLTTSLSLRDLGYQAPDDMSVIFERDSAIETDSVEDVADWLAGCDYDDSGEDHQNPRAWKHPVDFEQTRNGICTDFALWAWRKLVEMKYESKLFMGERQGNGSVRQHAWVIFADKGAVYLLEPALKDKARIIEPLEKKKLTYVPWVSVDEKLRIRVYAGYCSAIKRHNKWKV